MTWQSMAIRKRVSRSASHRVARIPSSQVTSSAMAARVARDKRATASR